MTEQSTMLSIIEKASTSKDVNVDNLKAMLDMQERIMNKNAEIAFNQAMTRLQPKLPAIKKDAKIKHNGKLISTYAKYEDIDRIIRPLYIEEGFSVSFNSKKNADGSVTYYGTLAHVEGHSRTAEIDLPADTSGAKNAVQAKGSTMTYAQRYLVGMLFNLVFTDLDDDGRASNKMISDEQVAEINSLIKNTGTDSARFVKFMAVDSVENILAKDYQKAINALNAKVKK